MAGTKGRRLRRMPVWLLGMLMLCATLLPSWPAAAHRAGPVGPASGLSIPTLTHGQMAVIAGHYADILNLADRQFVTDEPFQRYRNYITLQYAACLWGLMPGSLTDEESPFNECSHGYLSAARALLLHMKTMPQARREATALADRIGLEMLAQNATMVVCRYSDEPFNTADVMFPHWTDLPSHPSSLLALLMAAAFLAASLTLSFLWLRGPRAPVSLAASG